MSGQLSSGRTGNSKENYAAALFEMGMLLVLGGSRCLALP